MKITPIVTICLFTTGCAVVGNTGYDSKKVIWPGEESYSLLDQSTECTSIEECVYLFQSKVKRNWIIPTGIPLDASAQVKVKLNDSGQLASVEITESSGNVDFDHSIQVAIQKAAPFIELGALSPEDRAIFSEFNAVFRPD